MFLSFEHDLAELKFGEYSFLDEGESLFERGLKQELDLIGGGCHGVIYFNR